MQKHIVAENFDGYEEEPGRPIKTAGFGDGWIADFTAKEGFFKTGVRGCHATVLNSIHQYTVTCRCSPALFNDAKPLFEKVVKSMGVGSAP